MLKEFNINVILINSHSMKQKNHENIFQKLSIKNIFFKEKQFFFFIPESQQLNFSHVFIVKIQSVIQK